MPNSTWSWLLCFITDSTYNRGNNISFIVTGTLMRCPSLFLVRNSTCSSKKHFTSESYPSQSPWSKGLCLFSSFDRNVSLSTLCNFYHPSYPPHSRLKTERTNDLEWFSSVALLSTMFISYKVIWAFTQQENKFCSQVTSSMAPPWGQPQTDSS